MKDLKWSALKVPRGRVNKNIDDYIIRVYQLNKQAADAAAEKQGVGLWGTYIEPLDFLKQEIKAIVANNEGITMAQAVKAAGRTEMFVSREERYLMNAQAAIRSNPDVYAAVRKAWGWNEKIDWNEFQRTEDPRVYKLGKIRISFKNSPYSIEIFSETGDYKSCELF